MVAGGLFTAWCPGVLLDERGHSDNGVILSFKSGVASSPMVQQLLITQYIVLIAPPLSNCVYSIPAIDRGTRPCCLRLSYYCLQYKRLSYYQVISVYISTRACDC